MKTIRFPDSERLYDFAADIFVERAQAAIETRGRFLVALSGGRTPVPLYQRLAQGKPSGRIDWRRVHVFWADERCVPPDHEASNFKQAHNVLLSRVVVPPTNVHRIEGERRPLEAADAYEITLRDLLREDGRIDLVLLGLGADGHTASLFPRHQALYEDLRWILPVHVSADPPWRITMTLPLINAARHVLFLVSGAEKAAAVRRVFAGEDLPAARSRPIEGETVWLLDQDAAAQID